MTKREVAESILITLSGGIPNDDAPWSLRQILHHINNGIAFLAKKSAYENANVEGVVYADESFTTTFKDLPIQKDEDNGQYYIDLPELPVGLPGGGGLIRLTPKGSYKSTNLKPISRNEASRFFGLPKIPGKIFYYVEDGDIKFVGCPMITSDSFNVTIISAGAGNLDEELRMPPDMIGELEQIVLNTMRGYGPQDVIEDGENYVSATNQ